MAARSRFYASMSHELRTPINAVLGYSTLLLENIYGPLNEKQAEGITRTHKAAKHLLELVNDVLDISRLEAGKVRIECRDFDLAELVRDTMLSVEPQARTMLRAALPAAEVRTLPDLGHALLGDGLMAKVIAWVESWRDAEE